MIEPGADHVTRPTPRLQAKYSAIVCRCGCASVYAVGVELAVNLHDLVGVVLLAAFRDGWLRYSDPPAIDCPTCVEASDDTAAAFKAAAAAREEFITRERLTIRMGAT